jgi:hypothetical protein
MTGVVGSGFSGEVGSASFALPFPSVTAAGTRQSYGSAALSMPVAILSPTGRLEIFNPPIALEATGSSTTPDVFSTYVLNLYHPKVAANSPQKEDELTTYSNFAFDRIIRYKDDYYGVSKNGLFRLGGTTDYADPAPKDIAWSFKTCMTDFGVEQLQTVDSAYFGGRLGPEANITLYYGDEGSESYSYSTPQDSSAQNYRQLFGRGIRARYFALGVSGGGAMALDSIVFSVTTLTRTV